MTNLLKTTAILVCCLCISFAGKAQQNGTQDRAFWVETLTRIAGIDKPEQQYVEKEYALRVFIERQK